MQKLIFQQITFEYLPLANLIFNSHFFMAMAAFFSKQWKSQVICLTEQKLEYFYVPYKPKQLSLGIQIYGLLETDVEGGSVLRCDSSSRLEPSKSSPFSWEKSSQGVPTSENFCWSPGTSPNRGKTRLLRVLTESAKAVVNISSASYGKNISNGPA